MYEIIITPVKKLYEIAAEAELGEVYALVASSYPVDRERLTGLGGVLIMSFDDITEGATAITKETAQEIKAFVDRLPADTDTLFVCCDSGQSRSSAMAAALTLYTGGNDIPIWYDPAYQPNALVYKTLCEVLGVCVTDAQLADRQQLNALALKNAIKKDDNTSVFIDVAQKMW